MIVPRPASRVSRSCLVLFSLLFFLAFSAVAHAQRYQRTKPAKPAAETAAPAEPSEVSGEKAPIAPPATAFERVAEEESKGHHDGGLRWARFGPSWDHREDYSDRYVNEFVIVGGDYLGENWKNTYNVGGAYYFHFNDFLALGGQYLFSQIVVDKNTPFYASLQTDNVHIATGMVSLNTPAAWRVGTKIFNMDFYFTLGVGAIQINRQWKPTGVIGGGAKFYFPVPWIAFRLDINSYIHPTPMGGGREDLSGDVSMGGGISFQFPNKKIHPTDSSSTLPK